MPSFLFCRMRYSTCPRSRPTVQATSPTGTPWSPPSPGSTVCHGLLSPSWREASLPQNYWPKRTLTACVVCSTPYLRGQNVLFLVALFVLLYKIIVHEQEDDAAKGGIKKKKEQSFVLLAFNLSTFPVLFFFCCLYYTDLGAICFVLLGYYCTLKGRHITSAVVSEYSRYCILCVHSWMCLCSHSQHPHTVPTTNAFASHCIHMHPNTPAHNPYPIHTQTTHSHHLTQITYTHTYSHARTPTHAHTRTHTRTHRHDTHTHTPTATTHATQIVCV